MSVYQVGLSSRSIKSAYQICRASRYIDSASLNITLIGFVMNTLCEIGVHPYTSPVRASTSIEVSRRERFVQRIDVGDGGVDWIDRTERVGGTEA